MELYEKYILSFSNLSYLEKAKYGKGTNHYTKFGFMVYEPFSFIEFQRKIELNTSFKEKWMNI